MENLAKRFEQLFFDSLVKGVTTISPDVLKLLKHSLELEDSPPAKRMIETMIDNVDMANKQKKGVCQSPGLPCIYVKCGQNMADIDVTKIMRDSIIKATKEGYLRPSVVHPLTRKNSGDNSGLGIPNIELELNPEIDYLEVIVSFKGCGAELGNAVKIFTPASLGKNLSGLKRFVLETVINASGKPCPPVGIGIGIGGQMDVAAKLSRKAISIRKWDDINQDSMLDNLEKELLNKINQLGIGPGGVGGKTTALAVKIGMAYTHTAICPVAINFHCWVARRFGFKFFSNGDMEEIL